MKIYSLIVAGIWSALWLAGLWIISDQAWTFILSDRELAKPLGSLMLISATMITYVMVKPAVLWAASQLLKGTRYYIKGY